MGAHSQVLFQKGETVISVECVVLQHLLLMSVQTQHLLLKSKATQPREVTSQSTTVALKGHCSRIITCAYICYVVNLVLSVLAHLYIFFPVGPLLHKTYEFNRCFYVIV